MDCTPGTRRNATYPGPRCFTHHKAKTRRSKNQAASQRVEKVYNLSPERYQRIWEAQGGLCAVCGKTMGTRKRPSVDHDHACCDGPESCGECVRGLVHQHCNKMLGYWRDDPDRFRGAAEYLENPPAKKVR